MRIVFVHGACVRDGGWWWHRAAGLLQRGGLASSAPALPSCGETGHIPGASGPSPADDAAAVREHLQGSDEPVVMVAHSYGGMVVSEATTGLGQVQHLLFITSLLPEVGESLASFGAGSPAPYLDIAPEGTFGVRGELLAETFLQDTDPDTIEQARARLTRQSLAVTTTPVRAAAWREIPSTYLICARDNGTPAAFQHQQAQRARAVVELETPTTTRSCPSRRPSPSWS